MLRPKLNRVWSDSSSVARRNPGDAKYIQGWLSEIPTFQVLNYLQWKTDATFLALAERGVFEWGSDVSYKKGAAAWDETDGAIYIAQMNNPSTTLAPSKNANGWKKSAIQITRQSYDDAVAAITNHIADITGNPHKLTPGRLGTYTVAQIDELVAKYRAEVKAHADDTNNPHGTKATDIGAVPVTGGKYTGNVTMGTGQVLLDAEGKRKVVSDATGVYMTNGSGQVGIDATGKGFVKTGTLPSSLIVTQATFADNKATEEPAYAIPQPIFYLPLSSDLNLYQGHGVVNYVGQTDAWNPTALDGISIGNNSAFDQVISYSQHFEGQDNVTIAIDVQPSDVEQNSADVEFYYAFGSADGAIALEFRFNNTVAAWTTPTNKTGTATLKTGAWTRVVAVRTAEQVKLYVDGIPASSLKADSAAVTGSDCTSISSMKQGDAVRDIKIRNVRGWNIAMSDKQVSTL